MMRGRLVKVWGQIGVRMMTGMPGWTMGPPAEREWAVDPVEVEMMSPSAA